MSKIICLQCKEILESKSVHDFVECDCPNETFVDGGDDYLRIGGKELHLIAYWSIKKNRFEYFTTNKVVKKGDLMPTDINTPDIKTNVYIGTKNPKKGGVSNVKKSPYKKSIKMPAKKKK